MFVRLQHTKTEASAQPPPPPPNSWILLCFSTVCVCVCVLCSLKLKSSPWLWGFFLFFFPLSHSAHIVVLFVRCGTSAQIFSVVWRSLRHSRANTRPECFVCWAPSPFGERLHLVSRTGNLTMYLWEFNLLLTGQPRDAAGYRARSATSEPLTAVLHDICFLYPQLNCVTFELFWEKEKPWSHLKSQPVSLMRVD